MRSSAIWTLSLAAVLAFSLVSCGNNAVKEEGQSRISTGEDEGYYDDLGGDDLAGPDGMVGDATSARTGNEGWLGYQRTIHAPIPDPLATGQTQPDSGRNAVQTRPNSTPNTAQTRPDPAQNGTTSDPLEKLGEGVKNTIDDMGNAAKDLARDAKNSME